MAESLRDALAAAHLPSDQAVGRLTALYGPRRLRARPALRCVYEADAVAIARVVVRERLHELSMLDFGGLVACGTHRVKAERLLLNLLFPESSRD